MAKPGLGQVMIRPTPKIFEKNLSTAIATDTMLSRASYLDVNLLCVGELYL